MVIFWIRDWQGFRIWIYRIFHIFEEPQTHMLSVLYKRNLSEYKLWRFLLSLSFDWNFFLKWRHLWKLYFVGRFFFLFFLRLWSFLGFLCFFLFLAFLNIIFEPIYQFSLFCFLFLSFWLYFYNFKILMPLFINICWFVVFLF